MGNIGTGHWIFAGVFVVVFIAIITAAYRKDFKKVGVHYRHVWIILLIILILYFSIFYLNKII